MNRPRMVGMTTMATMIQNELAKEIQNVESENSRCQFFRPTHLTGPTPRQRVKLR